MSTTTNGHRVSDTFSDDVQMCVRAPENPVQAPEAPDRGSKSAYTRAIPRIKVDGQASKVTDFVSQHVVDAGEAVARSWPLTERPEAAVTVARRVFPAKGEAPNRAAWVAMSAAGTFRLSVFVLAQLVQLAVATRIRAGVALALLLAVVAAGWIATHL